MKTFPFVTMIVLFLVNFPFNLMADRGGGGGTGLQFDDRVIVDSPYVRHAGAPTKLSEPLQLELRRAGRLLVIYGAADTMPRSFDRKFRFDFSSGIYSKFIEDVVLSDTVEYRFVDELPDLIECREMASLQKTPRGAKRIKLGCTSGPVTWLKKTKMTLREFAKLIFHERLHSFVHLQLNSELEHEFISDMVEGLDTALSIYNTQLFGQKPILNAEQLNKLDLLQRRIAQLKLNEDRPDANIFYSLFRVTPNGGGLISAYIATNKDLLAQFSGYVSVGSILSGTSGPTATSEVIDSPLYNPAAPDKLDVRLSANSSIRRSFIWSTGKPDEGYVMVELSDGSKIEDSKFIFPANMDEGNGSGIRLGESDYLNHVTLIGINRLEVESRSTLEKVFLNGEQFPHQKIELRIGKNVLLKGNEKNLGGLLKIYTKPSNKVRQFTLSLSSNTLYTLGGPHCISHFYLSPDEVLKISSNNEFRNYCK